MIYKPYTGKPSKPIGPFIGFILLLISLVLIILTAPIGFIYGTIYTLWKGGFKNAGSYFVKIALGIDQLGNVVMQHLFNQLFVKKNGYRFGNRDETISSCIGKNQRSHKLTFLGKILNSILSFFDPKHALRSIDSFIDPEDNDSLIK